MAIEHGPKIGAKKGAAGALILLPVVAAFVSLRLVILLWSGKIYQQDVEELFIGNFAVDVLTGGPLLHLRSYLYYCYHFTGLLSSFLAVPLYRCFGDSFFCLKLTALAWSTATLILLYLAVRCYVDGKTALIACMLYSLPSENALFHSLWAQLIHFTFPCTLAMLLCYYKFRTAPDAAGARRWALFFGCMIGFSLFLWPSNAIAALILIAYFAWHLWHSRRTSPGALIDYMLTGIFLGLLPILPQAREIARFLFQRSYESHQSLPEMMRRIYRLCGPTLSAHYLPWGEGISLWPMTAYAAGLASYFWFLWAALRKRTFAYGALAAVIIAYPLVYIPLFAGSGLTYIPGPQRPLYDYFHVRYAYPITNILILSQAVMIGTLIASRGIFRRAAGAVLLLFLAGFGMYSTYVMLVPMAPGSGLRQPGCFVQELGCRIAEDYLDDFPAFTALLGRVDAKGDRVVRNDIARGAAWLACLNTITGVKFAQDDPKKFPIYEDIVAHHVPPRLQNLFREEIGSFIFWHSKFDLPSCLDKISRGLTAEDADASFIGVARMLPAWTTDPGKLNEALNAIPLRDKNRLAYAMGQYFSDDPRRDASIAAIADCLALKESSLTRANDFFAPITGRRRGRTPLRDSFLAGCREPYGTRMYWPPIQCH